MSSAHVFFTVVVPGDAYVWQQEGPAMYSSPLGFLCGGRTLRLPDRCARTIAQVHRRLLDFAASKYGRDRGLCGSADLATQWNKSGLGPLAQGRKC